MPQILGIIADPYASSCRVDPASASNACMGAKEKAARVILRAALEPGVVTR